MSARALNDSMWGKRNVLKFFRSRLEIGWSGSSVAYCSVSCAEWLQSLGGKYSLWRLRQGRSSRQPDFSAVMPRARNGLPLACPAQILPSFSYWVIACFSTLPYTETTCFSSFNTTLYWNNMLLFIQHYLILKQHASLYATLHAEKLYFIFKKTIF